MWNSVEPSLPALLASALFLFPVASRAAPDSREIIFASYNLEDYFQASDFPDGSEKVSKSPESIAAETQVIADIHPDIIGVCEMGPPNEFEAFKARLKAAGLDYPNTEYVAGPDPQRHVALLSRFPITARNSLTDVPFTLGGRDEKVRRGILDVTITIGDTDLRFVGVLLKSKLRDTPEDEAELRRNEAHLLRQHIDSILAADPDTSLVVYGDFNDTKNDSPLRDIIGPRSSPTSLHDLWLRDSDGDHWTEYWSMADVYSRIDYILVTPSLLPAIDSARSFIYRSPYWYKASDHRPIVAAFRIQPPQ